MFHRLRTVLSSHLPGHHHSKTRYVPETMHVDVINRVLMDNNGRALTANSTVVQEVKYSMGKGSNHHDTTIEYFTLSLMIARVQQLGQFGSHKCESTRYRSMRLERWVADHFASKICERSEKTRPLLVTIEPNYLQFTHGYRLFSYRSMVSSLSDGQ
jgi:hypothetical protein